MSVRDTAVVRLLDLRSPGTKGRPERERCIAIIGPDKVTADQTALAAKRETRGHGCADRIGVGPRRVSVRPGTQGGAPWGVGSAGLQVHLRRGPRRVSRAVVPIRWTSTFAVPLRTRVPSW